MHLSENIRSLRLARPKGIMIISSSFIPDIGGVETHLRDLISSLSRRGYKIVLLTFQPYQLAKAKTQKVEIRKNVIIYRLPRPLRSIMFYGDLWRPASQLFYLPILFLSSILFVLLYRKDIEIIHVHGILPTPIACLISKLFKKKCIMSLHHTYIAKGKIHKILAKMVLSLPDKILCLSNRSKTELLKIGLKDEKIRVFIHWIDQEKFKPLDKNWCKKILDLENKFVVLFVGRLIEEKGVKILLTVAKKFSKIFDDMIFVFVGQGPLARELLILQNTLKNIIYRGAVNDKDLPIYYNAADIVVVPSISEEGFGRNIIESLACGTPVIASNRGGIPEVLDSLVGMLIEPTADSLASAITQLYSDRDKLTWLANNCRIYAQNRFTEDNVKIIEDAYFT